MNGRKFFKKGEGTEIEALGMLYQAAAFGSVQYLCSLQLAQSTLDLATDIAKLRLQLQRENTNQNSKFRMASAADDLKVDFLGVLGELCAHKVFSPLVDVYFAPLLDFRGQPGPDFVLGESLWMPAEGTVSVKTTDRPGRICCNEEARLKAPTDLIVGVYFNPETLVADLFGAAEHLLLSRPIHPGKPDPRRAFRVLQLPPI